MRTVPRLLRAALVLTLLLTGVADVGVGLQASPDGWDWGNPQPQGNDLLGVAYSNDSTVWAVGKRGTIARSYSGGTSTSSWSRVASEETGTLNAIGFADESSGLIVGDGGVVLATLDANTFEPRASGTTEDLRAVDLYAGVGAVAVGDGGTILLSEDLGQTWMPVSSETTVALRGVAYSSSQTIWAVGDNGTLLRSGNGGGAWQPVATGTTENLRAISFGTSTNGIIVGDNGTMLFSTDGSGWYPRTISGLASSSIRGVALRADGVGVLVSDDGKTSRTTSGGDSWTAASGVALGLSAVAASPDASKVMAVGGRGCTVGSANYGTSWSTYSAETGTVDLRDVSTANGTYCWTVGPLGTIRYTPNGGTNWGYCDSGTSADLNGVDCYWAQAQPSTYHVWAVGADGLIRYGTGPGDNLTWSTKASGAGAGTTLHDIDVVNTSGGIAVGSNGTVSYNVNGVFWTTSSSTSTTQTLRGVSMFDADHAWAVGTGGTIIKTEDGGATWTAQESNTAADLRSVRFFDLSSGMAVGGSAGEGVVLTTSDGGANWTPKSLGTDELTAVSYYSRYPTIWYDYASAEDAYAVGANGAAFRTDDAGITWRSQDAGTDADLLGLAIFDYDFGWAVGETGVILSGAPLPGPDLAAPTAHASVLNAYESTATITVSSNDPVPSSGVTTITYQIDVDEPVIVAGVSASVEVTSPGAHTISAWASDRKLHQSAQDGPHEFTLYPVAAPPVSSASIESTYSGPAKIVIDGTDPGGSGVERVYYSLDGGSVQSVDGTRAIVAVAAPWTGWDHHVLTYWARDAVGKTEEAHVAEFDVVENYGPWTSIEATSSYTSTATVSITGDWLQDGDLAAVHWKLDSEPTQTAPGPTVDVEVTASGEHSLNAWSTDLFGNAGESQTATFTVWTATSLALTAPSTCNYTGPATLSARLKTTAGADIAGKQVVFERLSGSSWVWVASGTTNGSGVSATSVAPTIKTTYRARFAEKPGWRASTSPSRSVAPKAYLTRPVAPTTVIRGRSFKAYGYLRPRHTSGGKSVLVRCYRYQSGHWVLRKSVWATNSSYDSATTRYSATVSLPDSGTWRLYAYHSDAGHASTLVGYRAVTAK